ncbi:hypothetical protein HRR83_002385 [Exophiala dermatitidis]|uniref:RINT-1 family protein n=2 Tax=Exophiala dermatitidis TaxID=5970 RepID=A0AAN6EVV2_EXODE|nr:hypothetical protein HRR75_002260 [Exophiala dermatitidis]KAJ4524265.1 hypothetical protein HRR74_002462 [Exophiala dermatitidis]KAJ4525462.1 hypothetical protein HRR73_002192 [Exophiala dermatitidis]KAJ4536777.1 hypothetical protein HRR76_004804 [Exophiala dermatitidis]KAJ4555620.1 hypothetical protein HRR77_001549 [Exophiala dermatitidis]
MADLQLTRTGDVHIRVQDYLDDQIQTAADLEQVDNLLVRVQEQQDLLRKQLRSARESLRDAQSRVEERSNDLRTKAEAFQAQQADFNRRLEALALSDASDEATSKIEARMSKVRNLEIAQGYLELVQQLNTLRNEARQNLSAHPEVSLRAYLRLRSLWQHLQDAQPAAEGAAPQLLYMFEQESKDLYTQIKAVLEAALAETLEQMKWPGKELNMSNTNEKQWKQQVELLLQLQEPDLIASFGDKLATGPSVSVEPVVLLPLEVMVQPLTVRFRYHFYGERPTNRLDKPEYFLTHILDLLDRHSAFMSDMLGPILDERARASEALESIYTDGVSAFITALLPVVIEKCLSFLPQIAREPQLLSHFMHELMAFDTAIRESWGYMPIPRMLTEWKGVTWIILEKHGYFAPWLAVEKDFALSRYKSIRDAPDSGDVDFDADATQTKPTKGAIRLNDLLETITNRYRGLSSFSQKMKFLLDIQLSIFDDYHNHLHGALQAYLVASHTAGRLLHGGSEADAFGLKGLESLAKIYGSAEFLERKMSDWSDDVFFLELWDELHYRAKTNSGANASIGTNLRVDDVAAKTSNSIKATESSDADGDAGGSGLFDQTALAYRRLRERCEEEIHRAFEVNVRAALRPYAKYAQWSSLIGTPSDALSTAPSPSLDGFFETTAVLLGYLARVLSPVSMRRITKHYCAAVQREIYDNVLMHHTFSAAGAAQLKRDLGAIEESIAKTAKLPGVIGASMKRLEEAVFLLSLNSGINPQRNLADGEEDAWGFGDGDAEGEEVVPEQGTTSNQNDGSGDGESGEMGLWDAEKLIFESNEAARKALSDMGLYHLSEGDARNILKRRVELNG